MTSVSPGPAERLVQKLGIDGQSQHDLLDALRQGLAGRSALVSTPNTPGGYRIPFRLAQKQPAWSCPGISIPDSAGTEESKPGTHEDYARGYYYPLDLSSVWETAPLSQLPPPSRCLDMCSAPGGKTILTQKRLAPALHIANEIHPKRLGILRANLARCGFESLYTQRLRPDQWEQMAPESFDLVLVDAPCSGQSMLAKGIENPGCFHPSTMKGNAKRQRGILRSALAVLAPGGHLLYTTCTFAPDENEKTVAFLLKRHEELEAVEVPALKEFQSPLTAFPCYRLLPTAGWGSGGFSCLLRKKGALSSLPELPEEILAWPVPQRDNIKP